MKYKIRFNGVGSELIVGSCTGKMYRHFRNNGFDVTEHMCGNMKNKIADDITGGACMDTKFECDDLYHHYGPHTDESVTMSVVKEGKKSETVLTCTIDSFINYDLAMNCEQEVLFSDLEPQYVIIGQIYSEGFLAEYFLELKDGEFDPKKLKIMYHDIDEEFQIITGVQYNETTLMETGKLETGGTRESWYIFNTKTREHTKRGE